MNCSIRPDCDNEITTETPNGQGEIMYIYIKPELVAELEKHLAELKKSANINITVSRAKTSGRTYVDTFQNPLNLSYDFPEIPGKFIEEISLLSLTIDNPNCFRIEGTYELSDATLQCYLDATHHKRGSTMSMIVNIKAPDFESLREIYAQFRLGKILPTVNWEVPQMTDSKKLA